MEESEQVLEFWFGELDGEGLCADIKSRRWFRAGPEFDREIREQFSGLFSRLLAGERPAWSLHRRGLLAALIVLDQFPRNMFRGSAAMFAADPRALSLALEGVALGEDRRSPPAHRSFFYMPLMHAEDVRMQRRAVELFRSFSEQVGGAAKQLAESGLKYAIAHQDIVERFGRFPHRNALLGRASLPEELEFLQEPGSSF